MATWLAKIDVTLKPTVNDPPGLAIRDALRQLGLSGVESARAGKHFEIVLEATDQLSAEADVRTMCQKLLANPVIEQFNFVVEPAKAPVAG